MYRTRTIKFHNGKAIGEDTKNVLLHTYLFTEYVVKLCKESNGITKTEFVSAREDRHRNWTIKIKTNRKSYFNLIAQQFFKHFKDYVSAIEF